MVKVAATSMPEFKKLVEEVLRQKPDLDEGTLFRLIEEKKKRVGAGYLTDKGAIFLVATDLGVSLEKVATSDLTLKDLYIGANEITVVGRVFALYPTRTYSRRDGTEGAYRRLILFDREAFAGLTLWDDKTQLPEQLGVQPNRAVRVVKGYVKAGLDGRPVLNVGIRGHIELLDEEAVATRLPPLNELSRDLGEVQSAENFLSIVGVIKSPPKLSEFTRDNGKPGGLVQIMLTSPSTGKEARVAIWDSSPKQYLEASLDSLVRFVNVRSRLLPHGEIEFHGDVGSFMEVVEKNWAAPKRQAAPVQIVQPRVLRVLSIGLAQKRLDASRSLTALAVDEAKNLYTVVTRGEIAEALEDVPLDSLVACVARELSPGVLFCDSFTRVKPGDAAQLQIPLSSQYEIKISQLAESPEPAFLEVIVLGRPSLQDITTRNGVTVKKAEVVVGDETGEARIVAWRGLTQAVEGLLPGNRLRLRAFPVQKGRGDEKNLQMKSYSSIEKIT